MVAFVEKGLLNKSVYKLIFNEPNSNWSIWQQEKKISCLLFCHVPVASVVRTNLKNAEN